MIIRLKDFKCKSAISASRLDVFLECTAKYAYKYLFKGPDTTNSGAQRGSVCHDTFEILANKRHKHIVDKAIEQNTCTRIPALWKLIEAFADKNNVNDAENLSIIDEYIVTGLKTDFYGPKNIVKIEIEKRFELEVEKKNILYKLTGFIDRINWIQEGDNLFLEIQDYKSSKAKFDDKKILENHQSIIYQLAIKYLYPQIPLKSFKFIFLKFRADPYQQFELLTEDQLLGYEYWLTGIQKNLENFSEKNIPDNYAAHSIKLRMTRCGKIGIKKDGTPNFICSAYRPLEYYVLLDKDNKIIKSSFNNDLVTDINKKEKVEKRNYNGCSYYYKS